MVATVVRTLILTCVCVLCAPALVRAQTAPPDDPTQFSLEELLDAKVPIVTGASRFAQHVTDAPGSISIITREEIDTFGYRTLGEVLRSARGFYITNDRNYSYVGMRGLARPGDFNARVLLLIDGHRVNENIYDSALIGTEFPLDLELVDRVEVVRGPISSLYGGNALLAVVNVVTRRAADEEGITVSPQVGSLGTARVQASFARVFASRTQLLVGASRYGADGLETLTFPTVDATARGMDADRATRVFASLSRGAWSTQLVAASRTKDIPTGAYGTAFDDPRTETTDNRGYLVVAYDRERASLTVGARAAYDWYFYDGGYAYGADLPVYRDYGYGGWWTFDGTVSRRHSVHTATAGFELQENRRQEQGQFDDADPRIWYFDDRRQSRRWGVFVQDELALGERVILNAGLRYNREYEGDAETHPRLAFIYKPARTTSLKVLHGTAFRAPNVYERYYYGENRELQSEKIRTTELVAERYGANGFRVAGSAFFYRLEGLITPEANPDDLSELRFYNAAPIEVVGAEFEAERVWVGGWQGAVTLTLQDGSNGGAELLSNSPNYLARGRVAGPLWPGVARFGVETLYTGGRHLVSGGHTGGFVLGQVTARTIRPLAGFTLALDIDNVLDRAYGDPASEEHPIELIPQNGRTYTLSATWRF